MGWGVVFLAVQNQSWLEVSARPARQCQYEKPEFELMMSSFKI